MIKISVIIPVYNVDKYLDRCLNSLISQTIFDNLELIIVNDGSTDNSENIINDYERKYKNILKINQENHGVSSARNTGINNAKGEYIFFVDADDFLECDFLERLYNKTIKNSSDLTIGDYWLYFDNGSKKTYRNHFNYKKIWKKENAIKELLSGGRIGNNLFDKLFKRDIIDELRFDTNIRIGEDLLFIYHYLCNCNRIYGMFYPGYYYYQRSGSAMNSEFSNKQLDILKVSEEIKKNIEKKFPNLLLHAEALDIHSKYKFIERALKMKTINMHREDIIRCMNDIKKYKLLKGLKYLSKRHFLGLILIRISPKLYLFICKVKKI